MISDALYQKLQTGEREAFDELLALAVQEALKALPGVIKHLTSEVTILQSKARKFYKDNPDLVPHKKLVQKLIEREEASNPGIEFDQLLTQVLPKIHKKLELQSLPVNPSPSKPSFTEVDKVFKVT